MKVKLMATSDPELKASLRRKKAEEMKRYRHRKKLKAMTPVPCTFCSNAASESSDGKKSKGAPSIQEKRSCEANTSTENVY